MGRKTRKKIKYTENDETKEDNTSDNDFELEKEELEYNRCSKILEIKNIMINYCKEHNIELCDQLNNHLMMDFIEWFDENKN